MRTIKTCTEHCDSVGKISYLFSGREVPVFSLGYHSGYLLLSLHAFSQSVQANSGMAS